MMKHPKSLPSLLAALGATALLACGGPVDESAEFDTSAEGLARGSTTVYDGTPTCTTRGIRTSCVALDGVGHTHVDGAGRTHFVFNGSRLQTSYLGDRQIGEIYTEEHRNYMAENGRPIRMHVSGCTEIDGGRFSYQFYSQIANGELIDSDFEIGAECPF